MSKHSATESPPPPEAAPPEAEKLKFSEYLTSPVIAITVGKSETFRIHSDLATAESAMFLQTLKGGFKEAAEGIIHLEEEDANLFGYFVEYLYRNRSILSRTVKHPSEYVTLARLYAMGERLMAPEFQAHCLWRFIEELTDNTFISDESICELLRIACTEITERAREDPMRANVFWYGGSNITALQKFDYFHELLCLVPDLGKQLCLWMGKSQPTRPSAPNQYNCDKFAPESEYNLPRISHTI